MPRQSPRQSPRYTITLSADVADELDQHLSPALEHEIDSEDAYLTDKPESPSTTRSALIATILRQYFYLMDEAQARVLPLFSEEDRAILRESLNGSTLQYEMFPASIAGLPQVVAATSQRQGGDARQRLAAKVTALPPADRLALVYAFTYKKVS